MSIILVGLSQHTAPVTLRERLSKALGPSACGDGPSPALSVRENAGLQELAVLSMCNRFEVYGVPNGAISSPQDAILCSLAALSDLPLEELQPHICCKRDGEAVRHLIRVACGLESQVLGETQILGQVAQAYASARASGTSGSLLTYLFSRATHAGKRARSETEISQGFTSISHAAVALLEKELGDLSCRSVLVVGAGETAQLAVQALSKHGVADICCVNRTFATAQALAQRAGCRARPWADLARAFAEADAVITATGSPHPVIEVEDVAPILGERQGSPLVFVDIAVPRDVELAVGSLPGVVLHDVDHLEATLDKNLTRRFAAVPHVEKLVAEETHRVMEGLHGRDAAAVLASLREHVCSIARSELEVALRCLTGVNGDAYKVVTRMADRVVAKLLHQATEQLKRRAASDNFQAYCQAVTDLFGLEQSPVEAGPPARKGASD